MLLLLAPAFAFAPRDATPAGPVHRPIVGHAGEQGIRYRDPAFLAFRGGEGKGWSAKFDEATGRPRWLYGTGIPMPAGDSALLERGVLDLLERHTALFGFEANTLRARSVRYSADRDTWYLDFDELRALPGSGALPTWRGGISARVLHGNLVLLVVRTAPDAPVTGALRLSAADAARAAEAAHPGVSDPAEPFLFERLGRRGLELRAAWQVRTTSPGPARWVSLVDGETGEILAAFDEVRWVDGTVTGMHHARTVDGAALVESPMPGAVVESGSDDAVTAEDGTYSIGGDGTYTTTLLGDYANVFNYVGADGELDGTSPTLKWTTADATQAEIDTFVFLDHVQDWGELHAPEVLWVRGPVGASVNANFYACNAFYYGQAMYFFQSGYGCNNSGQIADVVYHEWGHGLHEFSLLAGSFDGSLSEGAADTVAFLQTRDPFIAPYFFLGGGAIRNVSTPNQSYPDDYDFSETYVHENGLIFGGSMWDFYELVADLDGEEAGAAAASDVLVGLLKAGPDIPDSYFEALVADDDDGDLGNGTPHVCALYDAFAQHGLGSALSGTGVVLPAHVPVESAEAEVPAPIDVELISLDAGCTPVGARGAEIHYRVDGGAWQHATLDVGGTNVTGEIPGQPDGSVVEYYVTGESDGGDAFATPEEGEASPYSYYVGDALDVSCFDFEADDGEWNVAEGDSFEWGAPLGLSADPAVAYGGTSAWGTDLGEDGEYSPNEQNTLRSPKVETKHYTDVFLQYRRWLTVEDAAFDQAEITLNGEVVWGNADGTSTVDTSWRNHVVQLGGLADQTEAKIGFTLLSDSSLEFGGWTLDDVCLRAPATPDNRLGITDLVAEATGDSAVHVSWTNPSHRPLTQVKLIRRADVMPEGEAEGEVVELLDDPERGAVVEVDDTNFHPGTTWYAVYGYDGTTWLSWTVDGWNADSVELVGDAGRDDTQGGGGASAGRCGCDQGTPSAAWMFAALLVLRRRGTPR